MRITLKRTNRVYVLSLNGYIHTFDTSKEAWQTIANIRYVDKKMEILYDMCMLPKGKHKREAVRQWLLSYPSEIAMDNAIHDVLVGNCKLEEMLKRKGYIQ